MSNKMDQKRIWNCCIDIYNNVQKWKKLTLESYITVRDICGIKLNVRMTDGFNEGLDSESWGDFHRLEELSCALRSKIESFEHILKKIEHTHVQIRKLTELSDFQRSNNSRSSLLSTCVPFQTHSLLKFCYVADKVWSMHKAELAVKRAVYNNICIINDKSVLNFFEASWKYEPNIDNSVIILLDCIIYELELFSQLS